MTQSKIAGAKGAHDAAAYTADEVDVPVNGFLQEPKVIKCACVMCSCNVQVRKEGLICSHCSLYCYTY